MKSIRARIMTLSAVSLFILSIAAVSLANISAAKEVKDTVYDELDSVTLQASEKVTEIVNGKWSALEALANNDSLTDPDVSVEDKEAIVQSYVKKAGAVDVNFTDGNGIAYNADGKQIDISKNSI